MPIRTDGFTPADYLAALETWRATAPANDDAIFGRRARGTGAKDAGAFAGLLDWRRAAGHQPGLKTNFLQADNDNLRAGGYGADRAHAIRPTVPETMGAVKDVKCRPQQHNGVTVHVPTTGDIERDEAGRIVRLGKLRFSDGTQYERCLVKDALGNVAPGAVRLPVGALLFATEGQGAALGPAGDPQEAAASNAYFAKVFGLPAPRYVKGRRKPRKPCPYANPPLPPTSMPLAEARAFAGLPPAPKLPTGLPCGAPRVADSFVGMRVAGRGATPPEPWVDTAGGIIAREEYAEWRAAITDTDRKALDAALTASSFADIGAALGHQGEYARRVGKRMLRAANDNLTAAKKKTAA